MLCLHLLPVGEVMVCCVARHPITKIIRYAKMAGLQVILDLHTAPGSQNGFDNSGETTPFKEPDVWGEHWLYDSVHMAATLITIEAMTTYINYIEEAHGLDNVMLLELLNEPWQMLDLGRSGGCSAVDCMIYGVFLCLTV